MKVIPRQRSIACRRFMVLAVGCLWHASLYAQAPAPDDPTVTVAVSPTESPPNGAVTISGLGFPPPNGHVTVTVAPPGGAPTTLSAVADSTGKYSVSFAKTQGTGTYQVSVRIGAKDAPARTSFLIKTYLIDIDEDVADNKALLDESNPVVKAVKQKIDDIPDSPAKTQLEEKLTELQDESQKLDAQSQQIATVFQPFKDLVAQHPDQAPVLQPVFDHLNALDQETKKERATVAAELAGSAAKGAQCDQIDHATEALKAVPDMMKVLVKPLDFLQAFAIDIAGNRVQSAVSDANRPAAATAAKAAKLAGKMLPGAAGSAEGAEGALESAKESATENAIDLGSESATAEGIVERIPESVRASTQYKFLVSEMKSYLPKIAGGAKGPQGVFEKVTTLAADAIGYANNSVFEKYCQKFEGPFTATMTAHFYSKPLGDGRRVEWWGYTTAIKGHLILRYPKVAEGKAVTLNGQLEGGATKFTYHENIWDAGLYGKMLPGASVWKHDVPPFATDDGSGGFEKSLLSPTSFFIPVTGQLDDGKITLSIQDARTDFNKDYTIAHTVFMVVANRTLGIPIFGHFTLPYVGAQFILSHVVKGDYAVAQAEESMSITRVDSKDYPGSGNDAVYTINLKACNPGCP